MEALYLYSPFLPPPALALFPPSSPIFIVDVSGQCFNYKDSFIYLSSHFQTVFSLHSFSKCINKYIYIVQVLSHSSGSRAFFHRLQVGKIIALYNIPQNRRIFDQSTMYTRNPIERFLVHRYSRTNISLESSWNFFISFKSLNKSLRKSTFFLVFRVL